MTHVLKESDFEEVPWVVFDTERFEPGTVKLDFFRNNHKPADKTNMLLGSMFPEPQSFKIQSVRIRGARGKLANALLQIQVANKVGPSGPAFLEPFIFFSGPLLEIGRGQMFKVQLTWEFDVPQIKRGREICVSLWGILKRPKQ